MDGGVEGGCLPLPPVHRLNTPLIGAGDGLHDEVVEVDEVE
jgi:hypothetical protein